MLGVLTLYNITPGPALFDSRPALVWGLIASLFIGNVLLLAINIPLVGLFARMLSVPAWVLVSIIVVVGTIGVAAYPLRRIGVPMAPLILGWFWARSLSKACAARCRCRAAMWPSRGRARLPLSCAAWQPPCSWCRWCSGAGSWVCLSRQGCSADQNAVAIGVGIFAGGEGCGAEGDAALGKA